MKEINGIISKIFQTLNFSDVVFRLYHGEIFLKHIVPDHKTILCDNKNARPSQT